MFGSLFLEVPMKDKSSSFKERVRRTDAVIRDISRYISYVALVCLLALTVVAFVDVILSKFFSSAVPSGTEWIKWLVLPGVFIPLAYLQMDNQNVVVDILSARYSKAMKFATELVSLLCGALVMLLMSYCGLLRTQQMLTLKEASSTARTAFPLWPFGLAYTLGNFFMFISLLWCIFRLFVLGPIQSAEITPTESGEKEEC